MYQKFPWKRFWCLPEGTFYLDKNGYLENPEGEYGKYLNPNVISFEDIQDILCVILLGEPGIGKSQAIEDEIQNLTEAISEKNELILPIDLKIYGSEERLWKQLFESEEWKEFKKDNKRLHLFIDSLDEVRLKIPTITSLILDGLKTAPIERLSLRIACRTAEWPWSFKEGLSRLWDIEQVKVYELVPLRLLDVQKAANIVGINASKFVRSIDEKNLGPLASKPITLNLLLKLFEKESGFPSSQTELYEKGCLYLCEEPDLERRERSEVDGRYSSSAEQKFIIASRIAASLILSNRFAINTDIIYVDLTEDYVDIKEITGGKKN